MSTTPLTIHPARIFDEPIHLKEVLPNSVLELEEPTSQAKDPVRVDLTIQRDGDALIVTGELKTVLAVQCGRCGKWLEHPVHLPNFVHLIEPPESEAESVDLTPLVREDILLDLPAVATCPPKDGKLCKVFPQAGDAPLPIHGQELWKELDKIKEN